MECERKPDHEIKFAGVTAGIWISTCTDGRLLSQIKLTQTGSYSLDATMFTHDDLPIVAWAACMAFDWIKERQDAVRLSPAHV